MTRLGWQQARVVATSAVAVLPTERVALAGAIGRLLREPVVAQQAIPHYVSSAMDGWAVAGDGPWRLVPDGPLAAGTAAVVVTGGTIPAGTLGVLRREHGHEGAGLVSRSPEAKEGEPGQGTHVRPAGTEAAHGDVLVDVGVVLNPAHVAVAAAAGLDELVVAGRAAVRVLLTGDEVVESGIPPAGRVRDSFGPQLPAVLEMLGAGTVTVRRVRDTREATVDALSAGTEPLVIVTGGTGRSDADHLRGALADLGATALVDGVAMRPGSPSMLARLGDGRLVLGLPGNPLAAMVGLLTLGGPVLAAFGGTAAAEAVAVSVEAGHGHPGVSMIAPCVVTDGVARATAWRGSGMMRGLATATALLVVPPDDESGSALALPLPWV